MGVALASWLLALVAYYTTPQVAIGLPAHRLRTVGSAFLILALVLYPSVASTSVGLLTCSSIALSPTAAAALDGGGAFTSVLANAVSGDLRTVTVSVLANNKFFVCWAGSHRAAGSVAATTMALFVIALPAVVLFWARVAYFRQSSPLKQVPASATPLVLAGPPALLSTAKGTSIMSSGSDTAWIVVDPLTKPLVGDFRVVAW